MPLKFWKRDKPEKEKGGAEPKKQTEKPAPASTTASETKAEKKTEAAGAKGAALAAPAPQVEKAPEPSPADLEAAVSEMHAGLVDLGLTIAGTKAVFAKRIAAFPQGPGAFLATYREKPYRAGTRVLADWLGFRAPADFDPEKVLADVNLRLSSFKMSVQMTDLTWLDQELSLRKARLRLGDAERVVRFKDARDLIRGINEMIAVRKLAFLELETWSRDYAFLLVREPKWDKLAATKLVVVKAPQTAVGGECGECGAPVGENWHDCLSCGAVFGTD
jgi:hypothetical protein